MIKAYRIIIILIGMFLIYNAKRGFYNKNVEFFNKNINGKIQKIKRTRGTKVFYNNGDYFYLDAYSGDSLKVGDFFKKQDSILVIERNGMTVGNGKIEKPKESYFQFFFDI